MIRQRGFATYSLLEIIVVVCLVLILAAVAVDRLLPLRGAAEAGRFEQTLAAMRAGLGSAAVERALHPSAGSVQDLAGSNPLALLTAGPGFTKGAIVSSSEVAPGQWFFATQEGTLYYRVEYPQYFEGGAGDPPMIRMRIVLQDSGDARGRTNLQLKVLDNYHWTTEGSSARLDTGRQPPDHAAPTHGAKP